MARKLFTLDEIRMFLDTGTGTQDTVFESFIESATAWIEDYCNRIFESVAYDETFDGDGSDTLYLPNTPVSAVSSLVITSGDYDDTIPATDYKLYEKMGKIVLTEGDRFVVGNLNIAVSYSAGETSVPPVVKKAGVDLVRWFWRKWNDNRDGIASVTAGDITTTYETSVPAEIKKALDPYRRVAFA